MPVAVRTPEQNAQALNSLPPMPAVALKVIQVAQDPKSSASDLASVVVTDPGLSVAILRVVNSAAHRRLHEVTSVKEALVLLGFVQARNVAITGAIACAYAPKTATVHFSLEAFWRHSLGVAFRASELAAGRERIDPATAFTAGVLHNMARLAMFYSDSEGLDRATFQATTRGITLEEAEREVLGYDHCLLGGQLAERWGLPGTIRDAIAGHHDATKAGTLAALLASADRYCTEHGLLPGYTLAPAQTGAADRDWEKLLYQVDVLTGMILKRQTRAA